MWPTKEVSGHFQGKGHEPAERKQDSTQVTQYVDVCVIFDFNAGILVLLSTLTVCLLLQ